MKRYFYKNEIETNNNPGSEAYYFSETGFELSILDAIRGSNITIKNEEKFLKAILHEIAIQYYRGDNSYFNSIHDVSGSDKELRICVHPYESILTYIMNCRVKFISDKKFTYTPSQRSTSNRSFGFIKINRRIDHWILDSTKTINFTYSW